MKVNILGTEYDVQILSDKKFKKDPLISIEVEELNGLCSGLDKRIVIRKFDDLKTQNHILRHEIIHAFQFESGIEHSWRVGEWGIESETDWLAYQIPKIVKLFEELGI